MTSGIYAIVNQVNGKQYIGSSANIKKRWLCHIHRLNKNKHHCAHLQSAWNKYGKDSFEFVCLETCEKDKLIQREQEYIDNCYPEYNTNMVAGSVIGYRFSEEMKKAMSVRHTGFRHTEESKKKMSEIWSGKPRGKYSEERRAKISAAHKGKKPNANQMRGLAIGWENAKHMSPETRKKIGDAQRGRIFSEERKIKLSIARRKRVISEETKIKTSETMKRYWELKRKAESDA